MSTSSSSSIYKNLSPTQKNIARSPLESRVLVLAGPGTGKTYTMIRRLVYLILEEGARAHNEILVLSFSRAAVAEITQRLRALVAKGGADDLRFLNVRTFDSLATQMLVAVEEEADLSRLDYDERIALAVRRLSDSQSDLASLISQYRHVIVDEIQDLVGIRAQFVLRLLEISKHGFTLLGDPAQGIYDYLVKRSTDGPTSKEFLAEIRRTWGDALVEESLTFNRRVRSPAADVAAGARQLVLGEQESGCEAREALQEIIADLPDAGTVREPKTSVLMSGKGRHAVLCRTNADVLFTFHSLRNLGVPALVPPAAEEKGLPPWIGRVLMDWTEDQITQEEFDRQWMARVGRGGPLRPDQAWKLLKMLEGTERRSLNIGRLRNRLRKGATWTFDSEAILHEDSILVTTIHQSKGREFDRVAIIPSSTVPGRASSDGALEEARVLYVAASRAREAVYRLERHGMPTIDRRAMPSGQTRYLTIGDQNELLVQTGLETDIDECSHVSRTIFPNARQALHVQNLIWHGFKPGTALSLIPRMRQNRMELIIGFSRPGSDQPIPVGCMTNGFVRDLRALLGGQLRHQPRRIPQRMGGLFVFERRTVILPPFPEQVHEPFATSGFCVGIGIRGFLELNR